MIQWQHHSLIQMMHPWHTLMAQPCYLSCLAHCSGMLEFLILTKIMTDQATMFSVRPPSLHNRWCSYPQSSRNWWPPTRKAQSESQAWHHCSNYISWLDHQFDSCILMDFCASRNTTRQGSQQGFKSTQFSKNPPVEAFKMNLLHTCLAPWHTFAGL